jgi:hypothetical protein
MAIDRTPQALLDGDDSKYSFGKEPCPYAQWINHDELCRILRGPTPNHDRLTNAHESLRRRCWCFRIYLSFVLFV